MLSLHSHKSGGVSPTLSCDVCRERLPLSEAWLGFSENQPAIWAHRSCAEDRTLSLFGGRVTLWRAVDALERLWQQRGALP